MEEKTRDHRLTGKARRDDRQPPVRTAAGLVAGVAAVLLALVGEFDLERLERRQAAANFVGHVQCGSS